ncbi:MAG: SpaA isopeptide-forming pilin-related protein [Oscillospiraceae bacterium]
MKAHKRKKSWYRVVTGLACVVVFCTVYALILPAITMEKGACEIPEHTHSEACYTQVTSATRTEPVCTIESLNLHQHDDTCYDSEGNLTCGYADFVVHQHDSACYDENGNLWCPLPEIETHEHTGSCYAVPEADAPEVHTHTDDCYTVERDELTCTEHVHTDDCYTETSTLICSLEESDGHQHSDDCYAWNKVLTCDLSTEPAEVATEPVLVCGKAEILLHEHTAGCLEESGNLICGKIQVLEHQHTDACFETVEEPADTEALTCTLPEDEKHTHTALCYGTWELTCDMEEHTHTEECSTAEETEATEETEETTEPEEEMSGMEIDPSLPVMGTAYASGAKTRAYSVMTLDADTTGATDPVSVENYITGATLYYRTDENAAWTDVSGATDIPGDADFKLEISYGNVPIDTLLAAGGKMTYTLPALFRNATANGKITSGSAEVGTITVANNTVTLAFDTTWLAKQKTETNTVISGDFFVEAEVNLSQVGEDRTAQIFIGKTTINIDFAGDIVAKYGNVDLSKTVSAISEETDGDYLTYTLTVTAGADGCPEVKVVDTFADTQHIEEYVGVTGGSSATNDTDGPTETGGTGSVYIGAAPTEDQPIPGPAGENPTKPGTLVWDIGDMAANETRTLTYRVKLKNAYTGVTAKGNLQNTANVYSKTYQRDSDTVTFTPRAGATMSKVASTFTPGENGGGTITYTIWVKANADNSYVLDNVKIMDALDGSVQNMNGTLAAIRKNLSYDETSFHLYQGGSNGQNGSNGLSNEITEGTEGTSLTITDTDHDGKFNDSFTYYVGSLAPGESKTLTYTVNVEPGVFVAAGNKDFKINNRACIYTDDRGTDGGVLLRGYNTSKTINRKVWSRKLAGGKQETESTVSMSGSVYDATDSSVNQITSPDSSFTVPAGSYKYQVAANEAGDWDLSSASMADSLGSQYMEFVGYVRVEAYTISSNAPGSGLDDAAAIANLSSRTPDQTVWVKVDGQTSFSFTPEQIGLDGTQAYLLTYYAQPTNIDGITQVVVSNRFELTGEVGIGNFRYVLTGIGAEASVVVAGSNSFAAEKQSWYYEEPKATTGDFANGALYWVIKVDGTVLPSGTAIKDVTNAVGGSAHYIRDTSFVGVYTGNLGTNSLADYADLDSLIASNLLKALESSSYTVAKGTYSLTLTLNTEISLTQGDSLYLIVKTDPSKRPANKRDAFTYNNKLQSSSDGTNWLDHNTASKTLYGSENIFKELGRVFTYPGSGNSTTDIKPGTRQAISTDALNGAGTYVAWQIHVNYEGSLSGRYRVVEQIPVGMEVTYVRIWWLGDKYKAVLQDSKPTFVQLTAEEIAALGGSWTEHAKTLPSNNAGKQTNYYYTNGQQVIWDIVNLVAGGGYRDDYAVEIQIVCKVTDPDVLLGGVSKEFNNVVSLQNSEGTTIGNDSNGVTIGKQTLSKQGTYNPETNGGRYPFKITLNELGEDLVSGSDAITLVDDLSDTLILDTASIQVVNTKTGEVVSNWTASVEGQTLKIVLPDNLPLTVTYETTVNAAPGQTISISNNAHWKGYTTPSGGSVEVKEFHYSSGGTAGADTSPSVTVKKLDQYNTSQTLSGATFTLVEGTYADGTFTPTTDGLSLTGTTGEDGTLTFGKTSEQTMSYNTVYCLTETVAPEGYVLDAVPHYFAVAKQQEDGKCPTFPNGVTVWYQSADYTYQAYNHKGEATVAKAFLDAGGNHLAKIDGAYRFGIYAEANPTGNPLQTVTITYANSTVTPESGTAKFTNLTLGKMYYIYELDDNGVPIRGDNTLATVNGANFLVTYSNGPAVTIPESGTAAAAVTVTNQVCYPELPHTGGAGTTLYTKGGVLLTASAMFLLLYYHTKRRKEESASS